MRIDPQPTVDGNIVEWYASLPFVRELPRTFGATSTRRFAIHCELLGVSQLCLIHEIVRRSRSAHLYVIVPEHFKTLAIVTRWFSVISPMSGGRLKCRVDVQGRERCELEVILGSMYSLAFPSPAQTSGPPG